jgi:caffeoyl-CoA O-methyltransferase
VTATEYAPARPVTPHGLLAAALDRAIQRLHELDCADAVLAGELDRAGALAAGLDPYLSACTSPESAALEALADRTRRRPWPDRDGAGVVSALEQEMLCGHVEGQLLALLVRLSGARQILELGLFSGYSALAMAEALPADGHLIACEIDPDAVAFARDCLAASPHGDKIEIRVGAAQDTLEALAAGGAAFDLVFIDADKPRYLAYVDTLLDSGLLSARGVIAVDNTLLQGEPYLGSEPTHNGVAIAMFNAAIATDSRVRQVMLPVRDGLTLICRSGR